MKKCPFCAEEIKAEAMKCRHCGELQPGGASSPPPIAATALDMHPQGPQRHATSNGVGPVLGTVLILIGGVVAIGVVAVVAEWSADGGRKVGQQAAPSQQEEAQAGDSAGLLSEQQIIRNFEQGGNTNVRCLKEPPPEIVGPLTALSISDLANTDPDAIELFETGKTIGEVGRDVVELWGSRMKVQLVVKYVPKGKVDEVTLIRTEGWMLIFRDNRGGGDMEGFMKQARLFLQVSTDDHRISKNVFLK